MQARISIVYPISLTHAQDLALELDLPGATTIEPSRFTGFLCVDLKDAILFALRFDDIKQWPTDDPDVFLMAVPCSQEVEDWLAENPSSGELIEMVAVEFESASDLHRFEKALWP